MEINKNLVIEKPSSDSDNWYIIQQGSFTIDKKEFVLNKYNEDFPHVKIDNYDTFELVLNRSTKLQEWFAHASLAYTDSIQLPVAYKDLFEPEEYNKFFDDTQEYKNNLALESAEIEELSAKFDRDLKLIKNKYKQLNDKVVARNKFYPILLLNATYLPLSIQIDIEGYTPKTGDVTQQKSLYAREYLINYKRGLIEHVKNNPDVDVLDLIEVNRTK